MRKRHFAKNIIFPKDIQLIKKSGLFDAEYYIANYGQELNANAKPLKHFLQKGWREGKNPSEKFDVIYYLKKYPYVQEINVNPLLYYLKEGKKSGHLISFFAEQLEFIRKSGKFDTEYYLQHNEGVVFKTEDPLNHFMRIGWKENRNPNAEFDIAYYRKRYQDLNSLNENLFFHYLYFGKSENRFPSQLAEDIDLVSKSSLFDVAYYKKQAGELAEGENLVEHFLRVGWREGLNPSEDFSVSDYLTMYGEEVGKINPFVHYLREGQNNFPTIFAANLDFVRQTGKFDEEYYLESNKDAAPANEDSLRHFMRIGWQKGYNPNAIFDVSYYLEKYTDVKESDFNPFYHYLKFKDVEERFPNQLAEDIDLVSGSGLFDVAYYQNQVGAVSEGSNLVEHFLRIGWREGLNPSEDFNISDYLTMYGEEVGEMNPFLHYLREGQNNFPTIFAAQLNFVRQTREFDEEYYLEHNKDVVFENRDPLHHFMQIGWQESRNPNAIFDVDYYLEKYIDVKEAKFNPFYHYLNFKDLENRYPNQLIEDIALVSESSLFDAIYYQKQVGEFVEYKDLAEHFLKIGWREGLNPSEGFSISDYLTMYGEEVGKMNPFLHYLREGKNNFPTIFAAHLDFVRKTGEFDEKYYLEDNKDVVFENIDPLQHFMQIGWQEGRDPNATFDVNYYLEKYTDVKESDFNPFYHYLNFRDSDSEKRHPNQLAEDAFMMRKSGLFDINYYKKQVKSNIGDIGDEDFVQHFLRIGWREGLDPSAEFSIKDYLNVYRAKVGDMNPFLHYLQQKGNHDPSVNYEGFLDSVTCKEITGWIVNKTQPEEQISLDLLLDGQYIKTIKTHITRLDIEKRYIGANYTGFSFRVPKKWQKKTFCEFALTLTESGDFVLGTPKSIVTPHSLLEALQEIQKVPFNKDLSNYKKEIYWLQKKYFPLLINKLRSKLDFSENILFNIPSEKKHYKEMVDVIIPVYEGYKETVDCLKSVFEAKNNEVIARIIVINDASPNTALVNYLTKLQQELELSFILLNNDTNKGFVDSVNKGMKYSLRNDVVLLNSDTEVSDFWLDRLYRAASSSPKIATVTPFSNNATAFSFPLPNVNNDLPNGLSLKELNEFFYEANQNKVVEIPTAHGFCMYIKKQALNEVGFFNKELWHKGYGEENDFSMKARRLGWYNVLAGGVFVKHQGEKSFGNKREQYVAENLNKLNQLYPDYQGEIEKFLEKDPLKGFRNLVLTKIIVSYLKTLKECKNEPIKGVMLFVTHTLGGGVKTNVDDLIKGLKKDGQAVFLLTIGDDASSWLLTFTMNQQLVLNYYVDGTGTGTGIEKDNYLQLVEDLKEFGIWHIHYHHVIEFDNKLIWDLPKDINVKFDVTIHDYYFVCPRVVLTNETNQYCFEPDYYTCNSCLRVNGVHDALALEPEQFDWDIRNWRQYSEDLLREARKIFVPSNDTLRRIKKYLDLDNLVFKPHLETQVIFNSSYLTTDIEIKKDDIIKVAWIGGIGWHKGFRMLIECAEFASKEKLPLKFIVVGDTVDNDSLEVYDNVEVTYSYKRKDLCQILQEKQCLIATLLSAWPETYNYVLSEVWNCGLIPIAYSNLGAIGERIAQNGRGVLIDYPSSAKVVCESLLNLRKNYKGYFSKKVLSKPKPQSILSEYYEIE